tara:strand:- start:58 stop:201 length:144 start_codon:yes stop_codon:yes gene_type:complete
MNLTLVDAGGAVGLAAATIACYTEVLCRASLVVGLFGTGKQGSKLGK